MYDYLIVGAGFSGSVLAERLAVELDKKILIVEKRKHIGGNAYDEYDDNGILVHRYGPHLFHTNSREVFEYLSAFTSWRFYEHRVLADVDGVHYPIPVNRTTVNMLYDKEFTTDAETAAFLEAVREERFPVRNSEDIIVSQVGSKIFETFFRHYTRKQWQLEPRELSPSVCGRIPVRTNDDDRYFTDTYQYIPEQGYTSMFKRMLDHKNIEVVLDTDYRDLLDTVTFDRMIFTGPVDRFYGQQFGPLPYRSIRFEFEHREERLHQPRAQVNYVTPATPYTRVVEYKHITGQEALGTTISREYAQSEGEPYYPIPTDANRDLYNKYKAEAEKLTSVIFSGRLAEYKYYNMDQVVAAALARFKKIAEGKL